MCAVLLICEVLIAHLTRLLKRFVFLSPVAIRSCRPSNTKDDHEADEDIRKEEEEENKRTGGGMMSYASCHRII